MTNGYGSTLGYLAIFSSLRFKNVMEPIPVRRDGIKQRSFTKVISISSLSTVRYVPFG